MNALWWVLADTAAPPSLWFAYRMGRPQARTPKDPR